MSERSSEVPVQEREGQELGGKGKGRERPQTFDMTRVQAQVGDKRTRDERSPTTSESPSEERGTFVEKQRRVRVDGPFDALSILADTASGKANKRDRMREHARLGTGAFSEEARAKSVAAHRTEEARAKKAAAQRKHAEEGTGAFSVEARAKKAAAQQTVEARGKIAATQRKHARLGTGAFSVEAITKNVENGKETREKKYASTKADINRATGVKNKYAWMNPSSDGGSGSGTQS